MFELSALLRAENGFGVENLFKLSALLEAALLKGEAGPGVNPGLPRPTEDSELDCTFDLSEFLNPALLDSDFGPPLDELEVLVVGMDLSDPALLDPKAVEVPRLEELEFGFV